MAKEVLHAFMITPLQCDGKTSVFDKAIHLLDFMCMNDKFVSTKVNCQDASEQTNLVETCTYRCIQYSMLMQEIQ